MEQLKLSIRQYFYMLTIMHNIWMASSSEREFFTSISDMMILQKLEQKIATEFLDYYEQETIRLDTLEAQILELSKGVPPKEEADTKDILRRDEIFISHPTTSYKILKRFLQDWKKIGQFSKMNSTVRDRMVALHSTISKFESEFPDRNDLYGAVSALTRLQDTYNISAEEFADGTVGNVSETLAFDEIFEVGYLAMGLNDFFHAEEWFMEALTRLENQDKLGITRPTFITRPILLEYLAWCEYQDAQAADSGQELLALARSWVGLREDYTTLDLFVNHHYTMHCGMARGQTKVNIAVTEPLANGKLDQAILHTERLCELDPENHSAELNLKLYQDELSRTGNNEHVVRKFGRRKEEWTDRNNEMCRGEDMPASVRSKLFCRYITPHPMFILKPIKMEEGYPDPEITVYHDMLRDWEIDHVINISRPVLQRAKVHDPQTGKLTNADYRISKNAWFNGEMDEVVAHIERKTQALIGLDLAYSEPFQVSNYGIGGQYEPHFDHATADDRKFIFAKQERNRIATCLFYLTTVEAGGSTPFIQTGRGAIAYPVKGDMVFWYNLKRNGKSDPKTRHSACPVLLGSKWVANFWIHEAGQEFRRPCTLNPDE